MFRNYHIVIFKDRESGMRNLRLHGWLGLVFVLLFFVLAGVNVFLWNYYTKSMHLEQELEQATRTIQGHDSQMLRLAGKVQGLERDVQRVQQFDAKLRVMMNIGSDQDQAEEQAAGSQQGVGTDLTNADILAQHRDLFVRHMHSVIDELDAEVYLEEIDQQKLISLFRDNKDVLASTPSIWPAKGYLSSSFGYRRSPFTGRSQTHAGIDIANRPGTNIVAPANGMVTFSGSDGAYGVSIVVAHGNNVTTRYAHLQKTLVKVGQFVHRGEVIGHMGSSGRSTGPHLHYEVRIGNVPVNPMRYILD